MKKISKSISQFVADLLSSKRRTTISATVSGLIAGICFFDEIILRLREDKNERVRTGAAYFAKQRGLKVNKSKGD